jgi:hypothetical protein
MRTLVSVNLLGTVEQAEVGPVPYRTSVDGHPYVPVGDGGITLGVRLGDSATSRETDHVAPGACIVHPDPAAGHALCAYSCVGNPATVRTGAAAGAQGAVIGQRGEGERVIVALPQADLARLRPGDQIAIRGCGQGAPEPVQGVTAMNAAPGLLEALGVSIQGRRLSAPVRASWPSRFVGNGIGRPMPMWSVELSLEAGDAGSGLCLGDLVAITDLDARFNAGFRRGWITIGLIVHGGSPLPGHGPGVTTLLTGPSDYFDVNVTGSAHQPMTEQLLWEVAGVTR